MSHSGGDGDGHLGDLQVWVGHSARDWQCPPHRLPLSTAVLNSAILIRLVHSGAKSTYYGVFI